ncbi:MAG TPA: HAD family hydrolase, partial [Anaerolineales bacterium]|nr:HAD family hydrolase [Anaerolineales bacterium]
MPLDLKRIQALCFDLDGTLSDTDDQYARRLAAWLGRVPLLHGSDTTARHLVMWMESPGNALMSLGDAIGADRYVIPVIDWMYRNVRHTRADFLIVPGVAGMLPRLKQHYPLAVISAREERHTMSFLNECGLTAYFDVILTALSAPHTKPYPDPVLLAARMMGVSPRDCLMIGDTTVDVRAGRSAGAQTIGVLCGFGEEAELRRLGADLILPST